MENNDDLIIKLTTKLKSKIVVIKISDFCEPKEKLPRPEPGKSAIISFIMSINFTDEVKQWIIDNNVVCELRLSSSDANSYEIAFNKKEDAVLFKLRWL